MHPLANVLCPPEQDFYRVRGDAVQITNQFRLLLYTLEMDDSVITHIDQLDAQRLTAMLAASGALQSGAVRNVTAAPLGATNAHMAVLQVEYMAGARGDLPSRLVLKLSGAGSEGFGISEAHYYARDYVDLPDAPIPKAHHVAYSPHSGRYHILMEDLSEGFHPSWGVAPTQEYGESVAEALAVLHTRYWTPGQRERIGARIPGKVEIGEYMAHIVPGIEPMLVATRGDIPARWADMARSAVRYHPPIMLERAQQPGGFTVVHGDVNPGNVLSPKEGSRPVYLIDRQPFSWSLTTWLSAADVAYLMVHWWDTDLRRQFELPVLRSYHRALIRGGVQDYQWHQLVLDYRLAAVESLYGAAAWCVDPQNRASMRWVWFPKLQRAMAALLDLRCADLW